MVHIKELDRSRGEYTDVDLMAVCEGKEKSLCDYLPEDWIFARAPSDFKRDSVGTNYGLQQIWYQQTTLNSGWREQLILLRQIARARQNPSAGILDADVRKLMMWPHPEINKFEHEALEEDNYESFLSGHHSVKHCAEEAIIKNPKFQQRALRALERYYGMEDSSWAIALDLVKTLRKEGFDITTGVPEKEVEGYVNVRMDFCTKEYLSTLFRYGLGQSDFARHLREVPRATFIEKANELGIMAVWG